MILKIKRIDNALPLPEYQTEGSVAFDLYSRVDIVIPSWIPTIVPTNLIVQIPPGYFLMLASRSSTPLKKSLILANGIGVIDQDYQGDKDEIGLQLINFSKSDVAIQKGERIGQALILPVVKAEIIAESQSFKSASRGGFGSTGK